MLTNYREKKELRKSDLTKILPVLTKKDVYCKIVKEKALVLTGKHDYADGFRNMRLLHDVNIVSGADGVSYFVGERIFVVN